MSIVTSDQFARYLQVDEANVDAEILDIVLDASQDLVEQWCARTFASATHTEYIDIPDNTTSEVWLTNIPVTALTSVTDDVQDTGGGTSVTVTAPTIVRDDSIGKLAYSGYFTKGEQSLKVVYTGGYSAATMPAAVKLGTMMVARNLWANQDLVGKASETADGATVTPEKFDVIPAAARAVLQPYRRVTI